MKRLADLLESTRIELDDASDHVKDKGKVYVYQGIMQNIHDAFARRILDEICESELYVWCDWSYACFFKYEIPNARKYMMKWPRLSALMKSTRILLKQKVGNQCKL